MSHGITKPIDRVFSTTSTEWHGLAEIVPAIDKKIFDILSFPIIEAEHMFVVIDGKHVKVDGYKCIVGDFRHRDDFDTHPKLVPLHNPRESYTVITNAEVIRAIQDSIRDLGAEIVTAGTLEGGRKFFVSVDIGKCEIVINNNGVKEKTLAYLDFLTSHDGEYPCQSFDSATRQVCMNTVRLALETRGEIGFKVYHSKNAGFNLDKMSNLFNAVLTGRDEFKNRMEKLVATECSAVDARHLAMGYLNRSEKKTEDLTSRDVSTRSINCTDGIVDLFKNGQGNQGRSQYDLFNGVTEFYTTGEGVGKNASVEDKAYKARFGSASTHKTEFERMLCYSSPDKLAEVAERGKVAYGLALAK